MTTVPVADTGHDPIEEPVTLAELDASVGTGPDVPEDEVAVRYYTDEAFLTAIPAAPQRPKHRLAPKPRCRHMMRPGYSCATTRV